MDQAAPQQSLMALDSDPPECSKTDASRIARDLFGLDGEPEPRRGERDCNFRIQSSDGRDVILKISNHAEDPGVIDLQTEILLLIETCAPDLPAPRIVRTLEGETVSTVALADGEQHMVRALTYMPGVMLWDCARTPDLLRHVGAVIARFDLALRGFYHPHANQKLAWDLMRAGDLAPFAKLIEDPAEKTLVTGALEQFCSVSLPKLAGLRGQIIHNDANLGNVLVSPGAPSPVTGLIDFGDMLHGPLIAELAVAGGDMVLATDDPLGAAAALVAGYHQVLPLEPAELEVLYDGIMARLAVTLAIHAWRWDHHGEVAPDLTVYEGPCRRALKQLAEIGASDAETRFRAACSLAPVLPQTTKVDIAALTARRHRLLGADLSLSYSKPLHIVRGAGVWLYDADGRAYLDAYNNVAHVGHCHPHVASAIASQAALLNTNTRYLHSTILDYSEQLTALMPDGLDVCVFVNSGSEANDIAWRMAKAATGQAGALIMDNAYHGGTDAIVALSPEEFANAPVLPHIRTLEAPDTYRGRLKAEDEAAGAEYANDADRAIAELDTEGYGLAAFMVDTGFTSNGILDVPDGYLPAVADKVHTAGGLLIADEVQYGFGRPGSHFWGFEMLGATPDIVTLGKPVGNGHPLGVVVTSRDILAAFNADAGYFSTFGGNPVSCAAALAVLEVLQAEGLQGNAASTGAYLVDCLRGLGEKHDLIGDVRGSGLVIGVELVRDRETREPAARERDTVLDRMRDLGVLVGRTGELGNVIKIRPPMPFGRVHADRLLEALDEALRF